MERVLGAFAAEAARLTEAASDLPHDAWDRPTACRPWRVRELFAHIIVATARVPEVLAAPPPDRAEVSAADYYRPDHRFADAANAARVALAQREAAVRGRDDLVADFTAAWRRALRECREQPGDRVVRTRHGDAMLLPDFLVTRVAEVAVHGLDMAAALERPAWLTSDAGAVLEDLLLDPGAAAGVRALGWDQVTLVRKATGREPLTDAELRRMSDLGIRRPALG